MDSGGRSSDAPCIEVGSIFRSLKERRAAASRQFLEDGRNFTARNGGDRQKSTIIAPAASPWRNGRTNQSRVPLLRSEYVLVYGYAYEVSYSLSDELDLSSVLDDTRAYLYSPVLG